MRLYWMFGHNNKLDSCYGYVLVKRQKYDALDTLATDIFSSIQNLQVAFFKEYIFKFQKKPIQL